MKMSAISKAKNNIIFGFINKMVMMLFPFAIRSIIIWKMGVEYVGLSSLFSAILQVLSLAELGFGSAIVYSMYKPIAENNQSLICALLALYSRIYKIIGLIIFILGLAILPCLPFFISGNYPKTVNIYILYLIYLLNTVLSYWLYGYKQSLLIAHQRNDVESIVSLISNIIMYCMQIAILIMYENYYAYTLLILIGTVLLNIFRNIKVKKLYPWAKPMGVVDNEICKDMKKRVYGLLLSNICQVCRNSFDSIILSAFLGLIILGRYQNYYYVMNMITGFLHIITASILGGIGLNIAKKSRKENYVHFRSFNFVYNWLATFCTVCLLCLYQPFMTMWVGSANIFSQKFVICMCIYFYVLKIGDVISLYKEATGIYWEDRYRPVVESIANLVLNIVFVNLWGIYGVVLSTIVTIVFINIPWAAYTLFKVYFKRTLWQIFKDNIKYVIVLSGVSIVTYLCCKIVTCENSIGLLIKLMICLVVPNTVYFLLYCKSDNMKLVYGIVDRIRRKKG